MTDREPVETTNLDRYGFPALPWSRPRDSLTEQVASPDITWFLGTIRPDGTPHAAGIGALWFDGDLYFTANADTQKARNVAWNPAATLSVRLKGIDLVFDGRASRTTDPATLQTVAKLYRFTFDKVVGVATAEPYGGDSLAVQRLTAITPG